MAKQKDALDALIDATIADIMAVEDEPKATPLIIQEIAAAQVEETFEQKQERELREDYIRRAKVSHKEREAIFRDNGLLKEGELLDVDTEAMNRRCC